MRRFLEVIKGDYFAVIFALGLIACGGVLVLMTERITRDASLISGSWENLSETRSEKVHVVTAIRREMGYGGMIHQFKNYVLRGEPSYLAVAQEKLGGIEAALTDYRALGMDKDEVSAITMLGTTLQAYRNAAVVARNLVRDGVSARKLDRQVKVDDSPALEALSVLSGKIHGVAKSGDRPPTKAESINALRAAIGYGGMIHEFKNYVLRGGEHRASAVDRKIAAARQAINAFTNHPLNSSEQNAISVLSAMLDAYQGAVVIARELLGKKLEPEALDEIVRIDDTPALKALTTLDREQNIEIEVNAVAVTDALREVNKLVWFSFWITLGLMVVMIAWASWVQVDRRRRRQEVKLGEERFRAAFESGAVGSAIHTISGEYLQVNNAFCQILGYEEKEILGRNWRDLAHPDDIEATEIEDAKVLDGDQDYFIIEKRYLAKDDRVVWTKMGSSIIHDLDGKPDYILGQIVDISEQKQNENDLIETQEQLQTSILELVDARERMEAQAAEQIGLSEELYVARHEADAANKAKSEFLAAMSHEIRTPMTGVMGFADMLLEEELPLDSREKVFKIKDSTRSLMRIINDILDISKMEAGKLELEYLDFHLPSLISDVTELFQEKRKGERAKNVSLKAELSNDFPTGINSDPTRLRQILLNLVGNAAKFTEEGGIVVHGGLRQNPDGREFVYMAVRDTGIGIKQEIVANLFTEFTQADASITRRFEGTGLGLSICKRLVELMGGEIGAESVYGEGSTFWFTLPYIPASTEVSEAHSHLGPVVANYQTRRPLNILIVEDNELNQQIVLATITGFGHTADIAANGAIAVDAHKDNSYDLILMDVRMPEMSGPDATRIIRKLAGTKGRVPIIALTADAMEEHKKGYFEAGMDDVVTKPIDRTELAIAIDKIIGEDLHTPITVAACAPADQSEAEAEPSTENVRSAVDDFLKNIGLPADDG